MTRYFQNILQYLESMSRTNEGNRILLCPKCEYNEVQCNRCHHLTSSTDKPLTLIGVGGKCINFVLDKTLVEKLWSPFQIICWNPVSSLQQPKKLISSSPFPLPQVYSFCALLVLYLIFSIVYTPLWLCSYVVGTYGSIGLFALFVNYIARSVSKAVAFAGKNRSIQVSRSSNMSSMSNKREILFLLYTTSFSSFFLLLLSLYLPSFSSFLSLFLSFSLSS